MTARVRGGWRLIFTDLTALLLALVVMMYAMTKVDERRWQALRSAWEVERPPVPDGVAGTAAAQHGLDGKPRASLPAANYLATLMARQLQAEIRRGEVLLAESGEHLLIRLRWPDGPTASEWPPAWSAVVDYIQKIGGRVVITLPVDHEQGLEGPLIRVHGLAAELARVAPHISTVALVRRENSLSSAGSVEIDLECCRSES